MLAWYLPRGAVEDDETSVGPDFEEDEELGGDEEDFDPEDDHLDEDDEEPDPYEEHDDLGERDPAAPSSPSGGVERLTRPKVAPLGAIKGAIYI